MNTASAVSMAASVRGGELSARSLVQGSLDRIAATEPRVNAFTEVLAERALRRADAIDAHPRRARMKLAGVPFAVKNLFDIAGIATLAGSKIEREAPLARRDAASPPKTRITAPAATRTTPRASAAVHQAVQPLRWLQGRCH
jgi:Asp-tRNA(Asn)/Glu-tRNA(Gln) amidotransferase A subunit family amidase